MDKRGSDEYLSSQPDRLSMQIDFLSNVPLFAELKPEELAMLVSDFNLKVYANNEIIFHQQDSSDEFYIIKEGRVRIFRMSPAGNETSIQIFSTYDIIGELAAIDGEPRSATARAIGACQLLVMHGDKLLEYMRQIPGLALGMNRLLAGKVRWTASYAEALAQYSAAGRLLHIFLLYNEQFGQALIAGKEYILDLSLNQTDLASLVGVRRERVNRLLRDWSKRGLIEFNNGKIIIHDLPGVIAERDSQIEVRRSGW